VAHLAIAQDKGDAVALADLAAVWRTVSITAAWLSAAMNRLRASVRSA
jgi:hypothetical protein